MNELENFINMADFISGLYHALNSGVDGVMAIVFAIVAIAGLFQCFFGYKMMRACFAICGFGIGALGGLIGVGLSVSEAAPAILAALVCGIILALLLFHIYRLGVFVTNFALVAILVLLFGGASNESLAIAIIAGFISGIIAAIMVRVWTILSTGSAGGLMAGLAIGSILHISYVGAIIGFALAIVGIIFQFKTTSGKKKAVKKEEKVVYCEYHYAAPTPPAAPAEPETPKAPKLRRESRVRPAIAAIAKAVFNIIRNLAVCAAVSLVGLASRGIYALELKMHAYKPAH